ncbi:uncharacterized protein B0P05DRAFT_561196 [Gilbertella persicaria]|uniref:uncharacterized protein n=1 Tax=Gilbertella persicaria TaxID=101096 RepID=UPI0022200887|nr:uncharacterized protein B0P05DRAFT_561196 [Gilbertella persicaria]KAI8054173.1 hypothetical protein B0P05DRAFT_561196 [Gilbertella persicaria]
MSEASSPISNENKGFDLAGVKRSADEPNESRDSKSARLEDVAKTTEGSSQDNTSTTGPVEEPSTVTEQANPSPTPSNSHPTTDAPEENNTSNRTLLTIQQHPPPAALHLLSESQQQQLIQSYVHAQGHPDLANLTASSLAQAMVSPIAVPTLASNLLQQLQQGGNVITALPGPPPQLPHHYHAQPPNHPADLTEGNATTGNKRANSRSLSNDERRQRRLLRNRVAAKECRKKKKQHIHEMEEKIVKLEEENAKLAKEVEELKAKLSLGAMQGSEGYRLMKEVEELNAKLGMSGALSSNNLNMASINNQPSNNNNNTETETQSTEPIAPLDSTSTTTTASSTTPSTSPPPPTSHATSTVAVSTGI